MSENEAVNEILAEEIEQAEHGIIEVEDTRDLWRIFPQVFKRTGTISGVKKSPYHRGKARAAVIPSFEFQDELKNQYRDAEQNGHNAMFAVRLTGGSKIIFSKFVSDWFLQNSIIAQMWRCGWIVTVE